MPNSGASAQMPVIDTIKRDEVNQVLMQQNELVKTMRELSSAMGDVQRRTTLLQENSARPNSAQNVNVQPIIDPAVLQQINDGVKNLRFDVINSQNRVIRCK